MGVGWELTLCLAVLERKEWELFLEVASAQPCSDNENAVVKIQSPFESANSGLCQCRCAEESLS